MKKIFLVSVIALGAFTINAQSTSKKETKTEKGDKDEKKQLSPEERAKKQTSIR